MAALTGINTAARAANPTAAMDGSLQGGRVRVYTEVITLAAQASGDTITVAFPSKGETFLYGVLTASASLGGVATIAIGTAASTGKYRAAAVFTAVDTPTLFGVTAASGGATGSAKLTADETVIITVAAAALAAAGTLVVSMFFAQT